MINAIIALDLFIMTRLDEANIDWRNGIDFNLELIPQLDIKVPNWRKICQFTS